jgi:hypothetical protein
VGVEVHSLVQLNAKKLDNEDLMYLLPSDLPFTAATVEATLAQLFRAGFGEACIYYDAEYNGLVVCLCAAATAENTARATGLRVSLRSDVQPSRSNLDVLSIDCGRAFPQIVMEPDQVLTSNMFNDVIDRFGGSLAYRRDSWSASVSQGAFVLEHLDDEEYTQSKDEKQRESVISYEDMALRVVAKYLYSGHISAWCTFDGDRPAMVNHHIRIMSPIPPNHLDLGVLSRMPGVVAVDAEDGNICVHTQGSILRTYRDPRRFLAEVHAFGVRLAKLLSIFPIIETEYEINLGGPARLAQLFAVPSDQPKG